MTIFVTPQKGTSSSQAVVWAATSLPFCQTTTTGSITQDLRLPGQIADANTGLYQSFHRDYVPWLGRYTETDPLGLAAGVNQGCGGRLCLIFSRDAAPWLVSTRGRMGSCGAAARDTTSSFLSSAEGTA